MLYYFNEQNFLEVKGRMKGVKKKREEESRGCWGLVATAALPGGVDRDQVWQPPFALDQPFKLKGFSCFL